MCDELRAGHLNLAYWLEVEDENPAIFSRYRFVRPVEIKFHDRGVAGRPCARRMTAATLRPIRVLAIICL